MAQSWAVARAKDADGPGENDPPPGEGEGVFISSATIGDEPPQKRSKTACAADADVVEKVCFRCVITNMILNTNSPPPTSLDGRS